MNNFVKQKTTKKTEFREPILEKLQTAKKGFGSTASSTMLNLDNNKGNDEGTSSNLNLNSDLEHNKAVCISGQHANNQAVTPSAGSSSVADKSILDSMNIRSVEKVHAAETSVMDCDETFHSAYEEVDTSYFSCGGSLMDSSNNDSHDESVNISAGKGDFLQDVESSESSLTKESDIHSPVHTESKTKELKDKGESSRYNNLEEGEQDCGFGVLNVAECPEDDQNLMSKPSVGSLTREADSLSGLESNTKDHNKEEYNSSCDDLMEGECDKDSGQINKSLNDVHFNEEVANNGAFSDESGSFGVKEAEQDHSSDDFKEEDHDKDSDPINKPLNDVDFHEDSNDGAFPDGSDSSDEDLLTPPRFLYDNTKLKPDIRTPEKGIAPAYATPSPSFRDAREEKEKTIKYKLSFDKLIAEKAKHRERDAELAEMEAELQRGIENGGIGQMQVPSTFSDIESEEELMDGKLSVKMVAL